MSVVFDKKASEIEKLKQEHEAEKEELINQIGQLTVDLKWLKKNNSRSQIGGEKRTN
ncbi:hypothetical protein OSK38_29540 [Escherichia coli]|nr:hypothetical protein [Escherichia coli]